jgi:hypothetical protein
LTLRVRLAIRLSKQRSTGDVYAESIGGVKFSVVDIGYKNSPVKQRHYVHVRNGYALFVGLSYTANDDLKTLEDILKTVKLQQ